MLLIEREHYLQALHDIHQRIRSNVASGSIVLVKGEAGIGKTTLIHHLTRDQDSNVLWGMCDPLSTPRPLAPLIDIISQSDMLQNLMEHISDQFQLFSQFLGYLKQMSAGTVLVFEDIHWADSTTLDLVKYIARRIQQTQILLIMSYRDDEVTIDHPLQPTIGLISHLGHAKAISLSRLSVEGVLQLAADSELNAEYIHSVTSGNPFFVTEILAQQNPQETIPTRIRDAVLARKSRLSRSAQASLETLAIIGTRAEPILIRHVLSSELSTVDECLSSGILQSHDERIMFRHELARQAILESIPPYRQQSLHQIILDALEASPIFESDVARLSNHAAGADNSKKLKKYALLAAKEAHRAGAYHIERVQYARILERVQIGGEEKAKLLEKYAQACLLTGYGEDGIIAVKNALAIWEQMDDDIHKGRCLNLLSKLYLTRGRTQEAEATNMKAFLILESKGVSTDLAEATVHQAFLRMLNREIEPAINWGERGIEIAEQLEDASLMSRAYNGTGTALLFRSPDKGCEMLTRSLEIAIQNEHYEGASRAYLNLASGLGEIFQFEQALAYGYKGIKYTEDYDLDGYYYYLLAWQALNCLYLGRWDESMHCALEVIEAPNVEVSSYAMALIALGKLRTRRGDSDALEPLDEALEVSLSTKHLQRIAPVRNARAEYAFYQGDLNMMIAEAQANYDMALDYKHPWFVGEMAYWQWRGDVLDSLPNYAARPFTLQIEGNYEQAATLWFDHGCEFERAVALSDSHAEDDLRQALEIVLDLQSQPAISRIQQKMREINLAVIPRGKRQSTRENPYELTMRQMDVLKLLCDNLTNSEIAQQLFISAKTVEHHVSSILSKLQVESRREAVQVVREQNLLE